MPIAVAPMMRLCESRGKRFVVEVWFAMLFAPSAPVSWPQAKYRVLHCVILNTRPKLDLPRVSHFGHHAVRPVFSSRRLPLFARDQNHFRQSTRALPIPKSRRGWLTSEAPLVGSPADFGKFIADETEKWGKVVNFVGIKAD
jgi:hypothetical protein